MLAKRNAQQKWGVVITPGWLSVTKSVSIIGVRKGLRVIHVRLTPYRSEWADQFAQNVFDWKSGAISYFATSFLAHPGEVKSCSALKEELAPGRPSRQEAICSETGAGGLSMGRE